MSRAFLFILDSVGIGGAPDADKFGDKGSNTLGHIATHVGLALPNLASLGLGHAAKAASGVREEIGRASGVMAFRGWRAVTIP